MNNNEFDLKRFWMLIKHAITTHFKLGLIVFASMLLITLIFQRMDFKIIEFLKVNNEMPKQIWFWGGIILSSFAFRELHYKSRGYFYLTLPASTVEKYVSRLALTTIGYVLFLCLIQIFSTTINLMIAGQNIFLFNPFSKCYWYPIRYYIIFYLFFQSMAFLGSVSFRKYALVKTFIAVIIVYIVLWLTLSFGVKVFANNIYTEPERKLLSDLGNVLENFVTPVVCTIPILCWIIAYFRLKESEV